MSDFPSPFEPAPGTPPAKPSPAPAAAPELALASAADPKPAPAAIPAPTPPAKPRARVPIWKFWPLLVWPLLLGLSVWLGHRVYNIWHQWTSSGHPRGAEKIAPQMVWTLVTLGILAALAAAGDIAILNRLRGNKRFCRWYFRIPVSLFKRVLLLAQLALMAAVLYVLGVYYLGIKVQTI